MKQYETVASFRSGTSGQNLWREKDLDRSH
jgi:hypothetical protein